MTDAPEWLPELDELEKQNDGFLRSGYSGDYYVKVGVMIERLRSYIRRSSTPVVIASHHFDELLHEGSSYRVRCSCGYVTPTCITPLGADNLLKAHFIVERNKANVPTAPPCEHNWRIRGTRWEEPTNRVVADLYYCTRCLEHAERKR